MRISKLKIFILFFLLIGFFVRIAPIFHHQTYFWFDQGLDTILVKQLVVDHKLNLVSRYSGLAGVLMGPLWTWLLAIPFVMGSGSPVTSVIFFSVLGTISAIFVYKFLFPISKSAAILSFLSVLFSPLLITYSNLVASPHPLSFLFIFYIWFLYKIAVEEKTKFFIPILFLVGLFFQLEIGFALFTLPAIFVTVVIFSQSKLFFTRHFLFGCLVFALTFLPQLLFDLRHNFLISHGFLSIFQGKGTLYGTHDPILVRFFERAKSFRDDFILMALYIKPTILAVFTLFLSVLGWWMAFKGKLKNHMNLLKILLAVIITFYIGFSIYPGPLWTWYRAGLPVIYIISLMTGLAIVFDKVSFLRPIILVLLVVFIFQGANPQNLSDRILGKVINDNAILQNQEKALDYVYKLADGKPFSFFAYTPPVYDYIWQYNFFWYGQKKYGYLPKNWQMGIPLLGIGEQSKPPKKDEGLFFLILEPNSERPWEPDGWKKSYIKYGKVISTQTFPGKIIVEERTTN